MEKIKNRKIRKNNYIIEGNSINEYNKKVKIIINNKEDVKKLLLDSYPSGIEISYYKNKNKEPQFLGSYIFDNGYIEKSNGNVISPFESNYKLKLSRNKFFIKYRFEKLVNQMIFDSEDNYKEINKISFSK